MSRRRSVRRIRRGGLRRVGGIIWRGEGKSMSMSGRTKRNWGPGLNALTEGQQAELAAYGADHELAYTAQWLRRKGVAAGTKQLAQFLSRCELKRHLEWCAEAVDLV